MDITRLSAKGQITAPKSIRGARGWRPGTEFVVEETSEGILLRPTKPWTTLDRVAGCLKYKGKPQKLEEIDEAITIAIKRRHESGRY